MKRVKGGVLLTEDEARAAWRALQAHESEHVADLRNELGFKIVQPPQESPAKVGLSHMPFGAGVTRSSYN